MKNARGHAAAIGGAVLAAGLLAVSCRTPTAVTLAVRTDIPCADLGSTTITIGSKGELESALPTTSTTTCAADGTVGSLVVLPSGSDDDTVAMKVVSGYQKHAEQCSPPDYKGCVVARRALRYVPNHELTVIVGMDRDCIDVPCNPDETCRNGACVPATIPDPTACEGQGCGDDALGDGGADATLPPSDAETDATLADAPLEAHADAPLEAHADAPAGDAAGDAADGAPSDAGTDGPTACVEGSPQCVDNTIGTCSGGAPHATAGSPCAPGTLCSTATGTAACARVVSIGAGELHTCASFDSGDVRCWGDNSQLQLGTTAIATFTGTPQLTSLAPAKGTVVAAGGFATCAIRPDSTVACWGANDSAQLGLPAGAPARSAAANVVDGVQVATDGGVLVPVALGEGHVCAANLDGGIVCWGNNARAQLGETAGAAVATPHLVPGISGTSVGAGRAHSCAVQPATGGASTSNMWCWGDNSNSQLGLGFGAPAGPYATPQSLPVPKPALSFAGYDSSFSLSTNQIIDAWGNNDAGQLSISNAPTPTEWVPTATKATSGAAICPYALAVGGRHTCIFESGSAGNCAAYAGRIDCAGANDLGQLAMDGGAQPEFVPVALPGGVLASWVAAGLNHTCIATTDGRAMCWGANEHGQAGGAPSASIAPTFVQF